MTYGNAPLLICATATMLPSTSDSASSDNVLTFASDDRALTATASATATSRKSTDARVTSPENTSMWARPTSQSGMTRKLAATMPVAARTPTVGSDDRMAQRAMLCRLPVSANWSMATGTQISTPATRLTIDGRSQVWPRTAMTDRTPTQTPHNATTGAKPTCD